MSNDKFPGFTPSEQNWSKLPHQLIKALPLIETLGELKVIIYTLRHTWGYQDKYKKITLDEFEKGRKRKDGTRIDNGTGLTKPTIVDGIKRAVAHGFLFEHTDTSDTARVKKFYSLTREGLKDLTPDVKRFNTRGKTSLHRTEKETIEKETFDRKLQNPKLEKQNPVPPIIEANSYIEKYTDAQRADLNSLAHYVADIKSDSITTKDELRRAVWLAYEVTQICQKDVAMLIVAGDIQALKDIALAGIAVYSKDIDNLNDYKTWWYDEYWLGRDKGQPPTPKQITNTWGQFEASQAQPGSTNGPGPVLTPEQRDRWAELAAQDAQQK